jgi:hypothetical protein
MVEGFDERFIVRRFEPAIPVDWRRCRSRDS